eukprot:992027-Prymnesium_polylepis.3
MECRKRARRSSRTSSGSCDSSSSSASPTSVASSSWTTSLRRVSVTSAVRTRCDARCSRSVMTAAAAVRILRPPPVAGCSGSVTTGSGRCAGRLRFLRLPACGAVSCAWSVGSGGGGS